MRHNQRVTNLDRLSGLDASFLALEEGGAHMHVGSVLLFDGAAPPYEDFVAQLERRLALVPRYRQKLAFPPLVQSRPVWIDDPHFNAGYHVRHTALPAPAGEEELRRLAGRVFAQRLDRSKPLWELWLVDRVGDDRFAIVAKTHHCLVDGISGVDITTVLFDLDPEPAELPRPPSRGCHGPSRRGRRCWRTRCASAPPVRSAWRARPPAPRPTRGRGRRRAARRSAASPRSRTPGWPGRRARR